MTLEEKMDRDLKEAMLKKDAARVSLLRLLRSALQYAAIEKRVSVLPDAEVLDVIRKELKKRRESIEQFQKAGRRDLEEKEKAEAQMLESYLALGKVSP